MRIDSAATFFSMLAFIAHILKAGCGLPSRERHQIADNMDSLLFGDEYSEASTKWENGALSLVLDVLLGKIATEVAEDVDEVEALTEQQAQTLSAKVKGLYSHLKNHPALMDRRLYIGSKKPQVPSEFSKRTKKDFLMDIAEPVCPSRTEWRLLYTAKDINDTLVEVFQPERGTGQGQQWFYTVSCNNNALHSERDCPDCCIGIAHDRFRSNCSVRKSLTWALTRSPGQRHFQWNPIQVDGGCNCAIQKQVPSAPKAWQQPWKNHNGID